jgi:hypothetical protein
MDINGLKALGADVESGLARCMNNEAIYFRLIGMCAADGNYDVLAESIAAGELRKAFEAAHALKGVTGNLSLDQLYKPISEITELLRNETDTDYSALVEEILKQRKLLVEFCEN